MGMDVYGRNPTAPQGEYFRASIWRWPLLVQVITKLCPKETSACKHWDANDGDGLSSRQAIALADALERKLQAGEVALALCDATIVNNAELPVVADIEAWARSQGLKLLHHKAAIDENFVAEFAGFVRASGGFSIW